MVEQKVGEEETQTTQPSDTGVEQPQPQDTVTQPSDTGAETPVDNRGESPPWDRFDEQTEGRRAAEDKLKGANEYLERQDHYDQGAKVLDRLSQNPELAERVIETVNEWEARQKEANENADPATKDLARRMDQLENTRKVEQAQVKADVFMDNLDGRFNTLVKENEVPEALRPILNDLVDQDLHSRFGDREFDMSEMDGSFKSSLSRLSVIAGTAPGSVAENVGPPPSVGSGGGENVVKPVAAKAATTKAEIVKQLAQLHADGKLFPG